MKHFSSLFITGTLLMYASNLFAQQENYLFSHKIGKIEISMLSDAQSRGNSAILIGATPEMLQKEIPDGTFPNGMNAFLVRMPGRTILVDAGLGSRLFDNLKTLKVHPDEVDAVLITHMHGDHIGGLMKDGKAAFPNALLYIAKPEHDYWCSAEIMNSIPEARRGGFVQAQKVVEAYRVELFTPGEVESSGEELMNGVSAFAAYGHTPGHTVYLFESKGEKMLIWGDLTHAMAIQMPHPGVAVTYDVHPQEAVASRYKILAFVAKNRIPIAGMHIAFPAMGQVSAGATGGYVFTPFR